MGRLTILAKGNADVRGALHSHVEDKAVLWNGINTCLRDRGLAPARVIHETMTRTDAVLAGDGAVPLSLADRAVPAAPFDPAAQFDTRLFDRRNEVVILSIQADVMNQLARHADGHLLYPYEVDRWDPADRQWLTQNYLPEATIDADRSMANFTSIAERLRAGSDPAILILNMSAAMPWEHIHDYRGLADSLGVRIRRFNLALIELSQATGISVVDVDAVVARKGAEKLKLNAVNLTADGSRAVAEEVVRILDDLGRLA